MGYPIGLFFMFTSGIGCEGCGGCGRWIEISPILCSILWLCVMHSCFNVHGGKWLVHGFWQFGLHLGWQKNCSTMFNAYFISFVGVV